jgi:hypothetical protein
MNKIIIISLFLVNAIGCSPCSDRYHSKIKSVGGCDRDGDCGVMLEDGTVLRNVHQPVVGAYPNGLCTKG